MDELIKIGRNSPRPEDRVEVILSGFLDGLVTSGSKLVKQSINPNSLSDFEFIIDRIASAVIPAKAAHEILKQTAEGMIASGIHGWKIGTLVGTPKETALAYALGGAFIEPAEKIALKLDHAVRANTLENELEALKGVGYEVGELVVGVMYYLALRKAQGTLKGKSQAGSATHSFAAMHPGTPKYPSGFRVTPPASSAPTGKTGVRDSKTVPLENGTGVVVLDLKLDPDVISPDRANIPTYSLPKAGNTGSLTASPPRTKRQILAELGEPELMTEPAHNKLGPRGSLNLPKPSGGDQLRGRQVVSMLNTRKRFSYFALDQALQTAREALVLDKEIGSNQLLRVADVFDLEGRDSQPIRSQVLHSGIKIKAEAGKEYGLGTAADLNDPAVNFTSPAPVSSIDQVRASAFRKAIEANNIEKALNIARNAITDKEDKANALAECAVLLEQQGKPYKQVLSESRITARKVEDNWSKTRALTNVAIAHYKVGFEPEPILHEALTAVKMLLGEEDSVAFFAIPSFVIDIRENIKRLPSLKIAQQAIELDPSDSMRLRQTILLAPKLKDVGVDPKLEFIPTMNAINNLKIQGDARNSLLRDLAISLIKLGKADDAFQAGHEIISSDSQEVFRDPLAHQIIVAFLERKDFVHAMHLAELIPEGRYQYRMTAEQNIAKKYAEIGKFEEAIAVVNRRNNRMNTANDKRRISNIWISLAKMMSE